ncbi:lysophospholipid acyltransferase family protein [Thioclava sp. 'Guangxiensis']|uniref:lysophospholipid acyltransferase family protein n=1 Tax=Thioclava sp. 'Guangxiensis' TaxID=3149044 RepID=UPI003877B9F0
MTRPVPSPTWMGEAPPAPPTPRAGDRLRLSARCVCVVLVFLCGLGAMGVTRLIETVLRRSDRPLSVHIPRLVSRATVAILGIGVTIRGRPMRHAGAVVCNHGSWFDILALNAASNVFFVAKSEVAGWPGIGFLARIAGTVFIRRDPREAAAQARLFETRIRAGHRLLFFPEGTSSDTRRVLPFKSTLFQAFFTEDLRARMWVQPVSLRYHAPSGEDPRFYGWWGDMAFAPHLEKLLKARRGGRITLVFHPPLAVAAHRDRKALAAACEAAVRDGFSAL